MAAETWLSCGGSHVRYLAWVSAWVWSWPFALRRARGTKSPSAGPDAALRQSAETEALARGQRFWLRIAQSQPPPATNSRSLLAYALTLCRSHVHPERLERLFDLAAAMQDRDPRSPDWGNLKWYWRDPGVTDTNAVEFCVQDAATLWIDDRDGMPAPARRRLDELVRLGIEGCLRHRVPTGYTNMAILNAANLIVLGERFQRPDAAEEGRRRLNALCLWTATFGIHEFASPTYYGTDLVGLLFLHTHARRKIERDQAAALLELFWTDVALNWFPPAHAWPAAIAAAPIICTPWAGWTGICGSRAGWRRNRPAMPSAWSPTDGNGRRRSGSAG